MKNYKITIPEPCHENWDKMTLNEKGRFCNSCCETVVDFTKKSTTEIQEYFSANRENKFCGHFKKTQLDSIVIQIPDAIFRHKLSFQKLFLLALLLTMGSMFFSSKIYGNTQKIDKIELVDSVTKTVTNTFDFLKKDITYHQNTVVKEDDIIDHVEIQGRPITREIPPKEEEIKVKIIKHFKTHFGKEIENQGIEIRIYINTTEKDNIRVKATTKQLERKIKALLKKEILPIIETEVRKKSNYRYYYYYFNLNF